MNMEKKFSRWVEAGLLQREQAETIAQFERDRPSSSWVLFGIAGLGVVVLLTGLISVIAANWDEISASAKLVLYFLSLGALAWATTKRLSVPGVVRESLLVAFALYLMAGIGLIGQTYNLQSDGYEGIFLWLVMTLPLALISRARLLNHLWFFGLATGIALWVAISPTHVETYTRLFLGASAPYVVLAIGYAAAHVLPERFCAIGRLWSYAFLLLPFAIVANIAWGIGDWGKGTPEPGSRPLITIAAVALAMIAVAIRKIQPGDRLTVAIGVTLVSTAALVIPALANSAPSSNLLASTLFILAWSGAAAIAAVIERRRLFDLAAFVIGVRFVVVYFQVFGSLAATGVGLIVSGSVILGVAYVWHRYRSEVAQAIQERI